MEQQITKEEIAKRIRDNIRVKAIMAGCEDDEQYKHHETSFERRDMTSDYKLINNYWRVDINDIPVESKKPILAFLIKIFKRLVRKLTYWLYNPLFNKITEYNSGVARILNEYSRQMGIIFSTTELINNQLDEQRKQNEVIADSVNMLTNRVNKIQHTLEGLFNEFNNYRYDIDKCNKKIEELAININQFKMELSRISNFSKGSINEIANEIIHLKQNISFLRKSVNSSQIGYEKSGEFIYKQDDLGFNYLAFEERFRGSREDIKQRQNKYMESVLSAYHSIGEGFILDIGPGRGEFLELCRDNDIPARGVDINLDCVKMCQKSGLVCEHDDALEYLKNLEDCSLVAVTAFQVIEHLESKQIIELIQTACRKLKIGGVIILETVNPKSFAGLKNFHIDLTHVKLVMPETLAYLLEESGFNAVETKFSGEVPKMYCLSGKDENTKKLNDILFGYQDYAVVGRK